MRRQTGKRSRRPRPLLFGLSPPFLQKRHSKSETAAPPPFLPLSGRGDAVVGGRG